MGLLKRSFAAIRGRRLALESWRPRLDTWRLAAVLAGCTMLLPGVAAAQSNRYALIVAGASGEEQYAKMHREWVDKLVVILRDKFHFAPAQIAVLTETPKAGESVSNAASVKSTLAKLAPQVKKDDVLFVMLIGHGSGSGADAKFNLVGPDLTAAEWNELLKPTAGRIVFVDASSASAGFLKALAGPERVVITATNSPAQVYHPFFGQAFIDALTSTEADVDKNDRVSLWEAFVYASKLVDEHFQRAGTMATEHAVLDDTGEGTGRDAAAKTTTATLAGITYLDAPAAAKSSDPAVQALLDRREALTKQIDELRRRQSSMPAADFDQQFEKLAIELAQVSAELRKKGL
jgi:hypothetical protein